jgi:hypothetical protein
MWGALSDDRTCLSFTFAAGPRQRSHSPIRVPWDSRPYVTASDLRLPFSSPPTTRRVTVEVYDPASRRGSRDSKSKSHCDWWSVSQSVNLSVEPKLGLMTRYLLLFAVTVLFHCWAPSLTRRRVCLFYMLLPAQSFSGPNPLVFATIFYCLRFETSIFVACCH